MSMHVWFALAVVAYVLSFVSMALMRVQKHYSRPELYGAIGWYGFASLSGFLLVLGTGFTTHSRHGFGNPNHTLGWLVGAFLIWLLGSHIVYRLTKDANARRQRHS